MAALSAVTANTIQGSAPYLTFDHGASQETSTTKMLTIKLSDGTVITASDDTSSVSNLIELPSSSDIFASIVTLVPLPSDGNSSYPSISLTDVISTNNFWKDNDGDLTPTATGNLTVTWTDADNNDVTDYVKNNLNSTISACDSPYYKITVAATAGTLSTQYGDPNSSNFTADTHSYYIKPKIDNPYSCFAKPNLAFRGNSSYDGPVTEWNYQKGFLPQNINIPSNNFPTVGADGLFFTLHIAGVDASDVISAMGTSVSSISGTGVTLSLSAESTNTLKVMLKGPNHTTNGGTFSASIFKLYSDAAHSNLIYSFELNKWFIARPNRLAYDNGACTDQDCIPDYCASLTGNYNVPGIVDLVNGNGNGWYGGAAGQSNNYRRTIGGGLLAEWGWLDNSSTRYPDSDFGGWNDGNMFSYWAKEEKSPATITESRRLYTVNGSSGVISHSIVEYPNRVACMMAP